MKYNNPACKAVRPIETPIPLAGFHISEAANADATHITAERGRDEEREEVAHICARVTI